jgi:hypothetical protein
LDANTYLSRILFAQKLHANSWGYEKRHKRRRHQIINFCSGANMDAPLTALEAQKNPALEGSGFVGVLPQSNFQKRRHFADS